MTQSIYVKFPQYKTQVTQRLYNRGLINKDNSRYLLQAHKYNFDSRITDCYDDKIRPNLELAEEVWERGSVSDSEIPIIKAVTDKLNACTIQFAKILTQKDTDNDVLEIKEKIKKDFGIKELYLNNDAAYAKKIYKALEILKNADIPLADEIIVNSHLGFCNAINTSKKRIMILNSSIKPDYRASTGHYLHTIVHEGIHIGQPDDIMINFSKMPEQYEEVIRNLSIYADNNFILEVHAELKTKQLLNQKEFTAEEQEALDYIENKFKQQP